MAFFWVNNMRRDFSRAIRRRALFGARVMIAGLPFWVFKILAPFFMMIGRLFFKKKKKTVMENLSAAFGCEKTALEIQTLEKAFFKHIFSTMTEFIYFLDRPEKILQKVVVEGRGYLDDALSRGQGAIMLSAHFGSFGLMFLRFALEGYKTNFIIRPMRDKRMGGFITDYAAQHGINTIYALPLRECVETSLRALRGNQLLFILLDQNYTEESAVAVDFFGRPALTATGPVIFSSRAKSPILPVFITGSMHSGYKIRIEPAVHFGQESSEPDLQSATAHLTKIIEGQIRRYPHEWGGWMHRRWKAAADGLKTDPAGADCPR